MDWLTFDSFRSAWEVFLLFVIPVGGGIPAGAVLAKSRGMSFLAMALLYFLSDIALAICFEPVMKIVLYLTRNSIFMARVRDHMKKTMERTIAGYGANPGPFMLVTIAFGVDPMTGRAAAHAAGHGFIAGWTIAIIGDMFFFTLVAVSTLWLSDILGDGTWAAIIIMVAMIAAPPLVRKVRRYFGVNQ